LKVRAVILGFTLAAFIALATYFNDWVINQTHLIGNHLPIGVFGLVLLLLLVANPLLGLIGVRWTLKPRDLAIITALALAVCPWPGSNFFRTFFSTVTVPIHDYPDQTAWKSAQAMSYLPGGSARVASGQVRDWSALRGVFEASLNKPTSPLERHLAENMTDTNRLLARELVRGRLEQAGNKRRLLQVLNSTTIDPTSLTEGQPFVERVRESNLPAEARGELAERDEALSRIEQLESQLSRFRERRKQIMAEIGDELERHRQELQQIKDRLVDLRERLNRLQNQREAEGVAPPLDEVEDLEELGQRGADEPNVAALESRIDKLQAERDEAASALNEVEQRLIPVRRDIQRTERQIDYYHQRAVVAEQRANRAALVALAPKVAPVDARERGMAPNAPAAQGAMVSLFLPAPDGNGVLLNNGFGDTYSTQIIRTGTGVQDTLPFSELPWWAWENPLITWGSIAVLLTLAVLFMSMIVHPQWSRRELLSYPIVRFMEEVTERPEDKALPSIIANRLFWIGFLIVLAIHFMNGMSQWVGDPVPTLPLEFEFGGLTDLFPTLSQVSTGLWNPRLYLSAMAFAYFLNKEVSLSVGLSQVSWAILGAILLSYGLPVENDIESGDMGSMLRFGAYLGLAAMILYIGRRYYLNVAASAIGLPRGKATPAYATWAARGMVVCCVGAGFLLYHFVNLDWVLAGLLILCMMVMSVGIARVNAETGLFFVQTWWMPAGVIVGLLGASAIGPEGFLPLAIAGAVLMNDPREAAAPYFVNALNLGDRVGKSAPNRTSVPMMGIVLVGFVLAFGMTLYLQHIHGTAYQDGWADHVATAPFKELSKSVDELEARGELTASNTHEGLDRLLNISPDLETYGWLGLGAGLVIVFAMARLRLPWWPLHPVIFLVWGTYPANRMWFSFLLGWLIKVAITKFGGARAFRATLPLMVGVIAGEILAAIGWTIAGAIAYAMGIQEFTTYHILPG